MARTVSVSGKPPGYLVTSKSSSLRVDARSLARMPDESDLARRRALLTAALGFALLDTKGEAGAGRGADRAQVARQLDGHLLEEPPTHSRPIEHFHLGANVLLPRQLFRTVDPRRIGGVRNPALPEFLPLLLPLARSTGLLPFAL